MSSEKTKGRRFLLCFLATLLAVCAGIFYCEREKFRLPDISRASIFEDKKSAGKVRCFVITNVSDRTYLRLRLAIPCAGKGQRADLERRLPRLKHEFLMVLNEPDMETFIRDRNFEAMRRELVRVVNQNVEQPVETLYFEGFYCN
jgi:flagellar basal body-associated protein FliL